MARRPIQKRSAFFWDVEAPIEILSFASEAKAFQRRGSPFVKRLRTERCGQVLVLFKLNRGLIPRGSNSGTVCCMSRSGPPVLAPVRRDCSTPGARAILFARRA